MSGGEFRIVGRGPTKVPSINSGKVLIKGGSHKNILILIKNVFFFHILNTWRMYYEYSY